MYYTLYTKHTLFTAVDPFSLITYGAPSIFLSRSARRSYFDACLSKTKTARPPHKRRERERAKEAKSRDFKAITTRLPRRRYAHARGICIEFSLSLSRGKKSEENKRAAQEARACALRREIKGETLRLEKLRVNDRLSRRGRGEKREWFRGRLSRR